MGGEGLEPPTSCAKTVGDHYRLTVKSRTIHNYRPAGAVRDILTVARSFHEAPMARVLAGPRQS